ncbi:MAG: hypothetical protein ACRDJM_01550 [Actinomycetota bacterium]
MAVEINHQVSSVRMPAEDSAKYLGAMIPEERRLVLVPMDPQEPWEAFKRLRTWMKESKRVDRPSVDVFEAPASLDHSAKVIPLAPRHRKTS